MIILLNQILNLFYLFFLLLGLVFDWLSYFMIYRCLYQFYCSFVVFCMMLFKLKLFNFIDSVINSVVSHFFLAFTFQSYIFRTQWLPFDSSWICFQKLRLPGVEHRFVFCPRDKPILWLNSSKLLFFFFASNLSFCDKISFIL
jgi:hypothetical protein